MQKQPASGESFLRATHQDLRRYLTIGGGIIAALLIAVGVLLAIRWPFKQERIIQSLERFSSSRVQFGAFHRIYLPFPGYIANRVVFSRPSASGVTTLASVNLLRGTAEWSSMLTFTHRLTEIRIEGLRVHIPSPVPRPLRLHPNLKEDTAVTRLVADGAVLEISPRKPGGRALRFDFPRLALGNLETQKSIALNTHLHISEPPADLAVAASFGPFSTGKLFQTPLAGSFDLAHLDLGVFRVIGGILNSQGSFGGVLGNCNVKGRVQVPRFEVARAGNPVGFSGEFEAGVDGHNGDVTISSVMAHLSNTSLRSHGEIHKAAGQDGKVLSLDVDSEHANIEDLLHLFVKSDPPPLAGPISFESKILLPPGNQPFLRRVRLDGGFKITGAEFTHAETQEKVNALSVRARGQKHRQDPAFVRSDLEGYVRLQNAVAMLSPVGLKLPGAAARGEGTYNLLTQDINIAGKLAMRASLSKAAGGFKSILLLPLDPFFKKKNAGAVVPFAITGTYAHPLFRMTLHSKANAGRLNP